MKGKNVFDITGCVAVVTGGGRGNGLGIAKGLIEFGAKVITVDLNHGDYDHESLIKVIGDVRDQKLIEDTCKKAKEICDRYLILVNNAGITELADGKYPKEAWDKTIDINLTAAFQWTSEIAEHMKEMKAGSIISISSLGASLGFPNNPAYVASKGGIRLMTKAFARDLGEFNIRANNIAPGYIKTDMTIKGFNDPERRAARENHMIIKRWGTPEDLAWPAVFLASEASAYITGQDINVDGGWTANGLTLV